MKKRIFVLFVALLCLFSFASCEKDTPLSLYNSAVTAFDEATGFEAKMTTKITTKTGSTESTTTMVMDTKYNGNNVSIEYEGYDIIYVDGTMYMDLGEELGKFKMEISLEDFADEYGTETDILPEIKEENFENIELVKDGDNRSFTMTLKAEDIQDYIDDALSSQLGDTGDMNISNIQITLTFDKDNNLTKFNMTMDIAYDSDELGDMSMSADVTYEFVNIGTVPTITAPSDASEYTEMDPSLLGF